MCGPPALLAHPVSKPVTRAHGIPRPLSGTAALVMQFDGIDNDFQFLKTKTRTNVVALFHDDQTIDLDILFLTVH